MAGERDLAIARRLLWWSYAALLLVPAAPADALPVRLSNPTHFTAGDTSTSVTTGDFNGDGDPDVAVANQASDNVSLRPGTSGAGFGSLTNLVSGDEPRAVATGHFDTDADLDLVVANWR